MRHKTFNVRSLAGSFILQLFFFPPRDDVALTDSKIRQLSLAITVL